MLPTNVQVRGRTGGWSSTGTLCWTTRSTTGWGGEAARPAYRRASQLFGREPVQAGSDYTHSQLLRENLGH